MIHFEIQAVVAVSGAISRDVTPKVEVFDLQRGDVVSGATSAGDR
jgi:hypothetical protein